MQKTNILLAYHCKSRTITAKTKKELQVPTQRETHRPPVHTRWVSYHLPNPHPHSAQSYFPSYPTSSRRFAIPEYADQHPTLTCTLFKQAIGGLVSVCRSHGLQMSSGGRGLSDWSS